MSAAALQVRRVYDRHTVGERILVDRLWPRGVTRQEAALDDWLRDVAPSTKLRRWYAHDRGRFGEFARRYRDELGRAPAAPAVDRLLELARTLPVTLVTATRDVEHSAAQVLCDHLAERVTTGDSAERSAARTS